MSKTLTFLNDLDREFRSRVKLVLNDDARAEFDQHMDHIVQMFHEHDQDKTMKCYNPRAALKDGQLESTGEFWNSPNFVAEDLRNLVISPKLS